MPSNCSQFVGLSWAARTTDIRLGDAAFVGHRPSLVFHFPGIFKRRIELLLHEALGKVLQKRDLVSWQRESGVKHVSFVLTDRIDVDGL